MPLFILIVGGAILTLGDIAAKQWMKTRKKFLYALTLLTYIFGLNFLVISYKFKDIAVASITIEICNIIILSLVSIYLYREKLTGRQWLGIMVGFIALILLEL